MRSKNIQKAFKLIKIKGLPTAITQIFKSIIYRIKYRKDIASNKKNLIIYSCNFDDNMLDLNSIKRFLRYSDTINNKVIKNEIAIYSTFFGHKENITLRPKKIVSIYPHYFISNNNEAIDLAKKFGWLTIKVDLPISNNHILSSLQAKIPKSLPHLFNELNSYEHLIYQDDKLFLDDESINLILFDFKKTNSIYSARLHTSENRNILNEYGESMRQLRYRAQLEKTSSYILGKVDEGMSLKPANFYLTGLIIRDNKSEIVKTFDEYWYKQILECGIECQISFNFCHQRYSIVTNINESHLNLNP